MADEPDEVRAVLQAALDALADAPAIQDHEWQRHEADVLIAIGALTRIIRRRWKPA